MSKNLTNLIFNEVTRTNKNSISISRKVLKESESYTEDRIKTKEGYDNTSKKICPRCGKVYRGYPAVSRYDNKTYICSDCGVEEAMVNYTGGKLTNPNVYSNSMKDTKKSVKEEVNIENPTAEEIKRDNENIDTSKRKEIEDRIGELRQAISDNAVSKDEREAMEEEIKELESMLEPTGAMNENAKVLTEAPEDEEFELVDEPTDEETPIEEPVDTQEDEEMSDDEYEDEVEEDKEDTVKDDIEEPFYATTPEFDELRDVLVDLDYRLFLINDNMVCIGRLNGPDIEFLTSNRPAENTEIEKSEQNEKSDEVEDRAEEDGEQSYEYLWIKAPDSFNSFLNQVNVVYLSPDMTDEDKEQYAGIEASHESVMNFLMNELPEDKKEEHENEEAEEELEEVPEEHTEDEFSDEELEAPVDEEIPEDEEEEEE